MRNALLAIGLFIILAVWARKDYVEKKRIARHLAELNSAAELEVIMEDEELWSVDPGMYFKTNQVSAELSQPMHQLLDSLAEFLIINNHKMIGIKAGYLQSEIKAPLEGFQNFGLARADWICQQLIERGITPTRCILRDSLLSDKKGNFVELKIMNQET